MKFTQTMMCTRGASPFPYDLMQTLSLPLSFIIWYSSTSSLQVLIMLRILTSHQVYCCRDWELCSYNSLLIVLDTRLFLPLIAENMFHHKACPFTWILKLKVRCMYLHDKDFTGWPIILAVSFIFTYLYFICCYLPPTIIFQQPL